LKRALTGCREESRNVSRRRDARRRMLARLDEPDLMAATHIAWCGGASQSFVHEISAQPARCM